ncbi:MAG: 3-deoxy-manno-octulosonate cytidylyltransferase [Ignavibacteria bacterium]|nr:3-deoxy-manno-octulosonate cytidylyltransferase [Ignavibacteria bacterium]
MNYKAIGIIPARFGSTRFPGKPLCYLNGKTLIQRVWEAAVQSKYLSKVYVATDDARIIEECTRIGASWILTPSELPSGTDRVEYAARFVGQDADYVLNIQGDEPLLRPELLDDLITALANSTADVATPTIRITSLEELLNPTVAKVTLKNDGSALYFSRNIIPFIRGILQEDWLNVHQFWKHIGIYAYRLQSLRRFAALDTSLLEQAESLEQLRLLADGATFQCVETTHELVAVDTPEDAERIRRILTEQS